MLEGLLPSVIELYVMVLLSVCLVQPFEVAHPSVLMLEVLEKCMSNYF